MCRLLGYLGPPVALGDLLYGATHSLEHQSHAAREQNTDGRRINADGWGVGWYDFAIRSQPARYRTATPMWADSRFREIASLIQSGSVVAAVRNASPGAPVEETGNAPFTADSYLFAHNGYLDGFRDGLGVQLRRGLSERRDTDILGAADSEVIFAMILDRLDKGASAIDALREVVSELFQLTTGRLNFILSSGSTIVATRAGNTLVTCSRTINGNVKRIVASEPFDDDPSWQDVPERSLVVVSSDAVDVEPL